MICQCTNNQSREDKCRFVSRKVGRFIMRVNLPLTTRHIPLFP